MKKTDIAMLVFIASLSVILSIALGNVIFGNVDDMTAKVRTITSIKGSLDDPNPEVFNANAINPSVQLEIGTENPSTTPSPSAPPASPTAPEDTNTGTDQTTEPAS